MPRKAVREIVIDGDIARITLTRGYVAIIDAADVPLVDKWNWQAWQVAKTCNYAARKKGKTSIYLHNFLTGLEFTDHADGDGTNNRRSNLRECTRSQNKANSRLHDNNTSGRKGVYLRPSGRYCAKIGYMCRNIHLGTFDTREEASEAYRAKAAELFGEFARDG